MYTDYDVINERRMKHVKQKHACGCGVACIAMLTNNEYDDVAESFDKDLEKDGLYLADIIGHLHQHGWATMHWRHHWHHGKYPIRTEPWPPEPHGYLHLVEVARENALAHHYVVMELSGIVLDPAYDELRKLTDYPVIQSVVTVVNVLGENVMRERFLSD